MTDKDTFGEKLHQKEKADEDSYFAQRDRELIAKWKAQTTEEEEARVRERAATRCPKCGETLREVRVEVCPKCRGMSLEQGDLDQGVRHQGSGWLARCLERIRGR